MRRSTYGREESCMQFLVEQPTVKKPLGISRHKSKDTIKTSIN